MTTGLLVVWHSRTGAAEALARAAWAAAHAADSRSTLLAATQATPQSLLDAAAYLIVCPENLGSMTGEMKALFDRAYYPLLGKVEGRAYATIVAAGSAGQGAESQIDRIVTGWRLRRAAPGLIVNTAAQTPERILAPKQVAPAMLRSAAELGAALAEGLALGIF